MATAWGIGARVAEDAVSLPQIRSESLGGSPLARRLIGGETPREWYLPRPSTAAEWRVRSEETRLRTASDWFAALSPAFDARGSARERLERVALQRGVVVTTGQQPGLFGGPIYTWSKAISALEFADALERSTGIPTAPVFWAATDDADFAEASTTWIALRGGAERLQMASQEADGIPMADCPLGDVGALLERLERAAGSAIDPSVLARLRETYKPSATIGGAYLAFLRTMLEPLGIAVLDASHPALLDAERPLLERALRRGAVVAESLAERAVALQGSGYSPQVADVAGLSLVFRRDDEGRKVRVAIADADRVIAQGASERLSPNVLLRPVVEQAVLPTVAYLAGPGEISYFAQVSAVATALGVATPLVLPRWSCTIVEPHIEAILAARGTTVEELADPAAVQGRLARESAPPGLMEALEAWRASIGEGADTLGAAAREAGSIVPPEVVEGARRQMQWRTERLERRLVAALKRRDADRQGDIATLAGALYPGGGRQERALNLVPILARHGMGVIDAMRSAARNHAEALVAGTPIPVDPA